MGVPDSATPLIADEVAAVARRACRSHGVLLGADATAAQLRLHGAESRFVHIATHGVFRRDNPLFSSIRLGDGPLCVYDLVRAAVAGGPRDVERLQHRSERGGSEGTSSLDLCGLLYAGARALLLTLWDVNDGSTSEFMKAFYSRLRDGWGRPGRHRKAMRSYENGMRIRSIGHRSH